MSKNEKTTEAASTLPESVIQKSKVTLSTFNPKRIAAEKDETRKLFLGTLIGRATGVVQRKKPNGDEIFMGLAGNFEAHVTGSDPVTSGILFIPDSFQAPLIQALSDEVDAKSGEVITPAANSLQVAYRVYCVRDGNPQGYSWELESIIDPTIGKPLDPLANLRVLVNKTSEQKLLK